MTPPVAHPASRLLLTSDLARYCVCHVKCVGQCISVHAPTQSCTRCRQTSCRPCQSFWPAPWPAGLRVSNRFNTSLAAIGTVIDQIAPICLANALVVVGSCAPARAAMDVPVWRHGMRITSWMHAPGIEASMLAKKIPITPPNTNPAQR